MNKTQTNLMVITLAAYALLGWLTASPTAADQADSNGVPVNEARLDAAGTTTVSVYPLPYFITNSPLGCNACLGLANTGDVAAAVTVRLCTPSGLSAAVSVPAHASRQYFLFPPLGSSQPSLFTSLAVKTAGALVVETTAGRVQAQLLSWPSLFPFNIVPSSYNPLYADTPAASFTLPFDADSVLRAQLLLANPGTASVTVNVERVPTAGAAPVSTAVTVAAGRAAVVDLKALFATGVKRGLVRSTASAPFSAWSLTDRGLGGVLLGYGRPMRTGAGYLLPGGWLNLLAELVLANPGSQAVHFQAAAYDQDGTLLKQGPAQEVAPGALQRILTPGLLLPGLFPIAETSYVTLTCDGAGQAALLVPLINGLLVSRACLPLVEPFPAWSVLRGTTTTPLALHLVNPGAAALTATLRDEAAAPGAPPAATVGLPGRAHRWVTVPAGLLFSLSAPDKLWAWQVNSAIGAPRWALTVSEGAVFPLPVLSSVQRLSFAENHTKINIRLTGDKFLPPPGGSTVHAGTGIYTPVFISTTTLEVTVPLAEFAADSRMALSVENPAPGGGVSATVYLDKGAPVITALTPAKAVAGATGVSVTLSADPVYPDTLIKANGTALATTYAVDAGGNATLAATLPDALTAQAGTLAITAATPGAGGGESAPVSFTVTNPTPALASINPGQAYEGSADLTITLNGSNFIPTSQALAGTVALATQYVSPTQLQAVLPATLLATPTTLSVTVANPAPGGGECAPQTFTVLSATPVLQAVTPAAVTAGSAGVQIRADGAPFFSNSVLRANGSDLATSYNANPGGDPYLTATLPDILTASAQVVQIIVHNTPGG